VSNGVDRGGDPPPAAGRVDLAGLVWTLVRTDFKVRYHGTFAGFLWALAKPAAMFLVLMSVFSLLFARAPDYRLDLLVGLFLWDFFAESTKVGLLSLASKGYLLTKARFPAWILVATSLSNALVTLFAFVVALLAALLVLGRFPDPLRLALFLLHLVEFAMIALGFALAASVLFLRFRDLNQVWEVISQAGFFIAPVIYPLDILPERYHFWLYLWPPTPVIQFSRALLVHGAIPTFRANLLLGIEALVCLGVGALVFRRLAPRSAEYL
jgi:lipopolysaccharide transport system permease protein